MIYNVDKIDVMGKRKDGGIDLVIVSTGELDSSPETQTLILDKVENYLKYINSKEFFDEFGEVEPSKITIEIQTGSKPDQTIMALFMKIKEWVEKSNASIKFTLKE